MSIENLERLVKLHRSLTEDAHTLRNKSGELPTYEAGHDSTKALAALAQLIVAESNKS